MIPQLPVIDIADLSDPATRAAIDRACREWGFFEAVGHGLDADLMAELFAVARAFFAEPHEAKRRIRRDAENPWGYFDDELTKNRRDWKEIFDVGPTDGARQLPRWPQPGLRERFEPALHSAYAACAQLALELLSAVAANLGAEPDSLASSFGAAHTSFLRLNHYPPLPDDPAPEAAPLGVGEHTDAGALTVLLQDGRPGLEVRHAGAWVPVQARQGAVIVNIGDIVQVWSNDTCTAAVHRVVANTAFDRYSAAFFLNPSYETRYAPLPSAVSRQRPARYHPISWREFRSRRSAGDYADLGEEVQISHYAVEGSTRP